MNGTRGTRWRVALAEEGRRHVGAALDWIWPSQCSRCGARVACAREQFCETCWGSLRTLAPADRTWLVQGVRAHAAFAVNGHFLEMLTTSKYRRVRPVGWRLAREAASRLAFAGAGALVPVPLTRDKRRERGFNQPEDFAHALSDVGLGPVRADILTRRRGGRALAGRRRKERAAAVAGAFRAVAAARSIPLVLVDDVVTTGSTALACVQALRSAGWDQVQVVAMGRAFQASQDRAHPGSDLWERL
ncbi:MAG: amidophosphoribosyltransferase [Gemmatimonadota bacterium]|nr:MAG: amidophosphoribosyltransferase [Gemmatimonadota bacterium]